MSQFIFFDDSSHSPAAFFSQYKNFFSGLVTLSWQRPLSYRNKRVNKSSYRKYAILKNLSTSVYQIQV